MEIGDYSKELCGGTHVHHTGHVAVVRILHEGSIGSGMRRIEALVGPDALLEINTERALLRGLVEAVGSNDPATAAEHARKIVEENKRLKGELGPPSRGGPRCGHHRPGGGRRPGGRGGAGGPRRSRARIAAACGEPGAEGPGPALGSGGRASSWVTARAARRCWWPPSPGPPWSEGSPPPAILATAATVIGGGAGGKDILANAGGKHPERVPDALGGIPARLEELLGAR